MARRRKTLSQNFLHNPAAVRRIVRAAAIGPDDLVLEPGAGRGVLTRALARDCRRVIAYEVDPQLAAALPGRLRGYPGARPVRGDFLTARPPREPFAVVGNIPYARTSDMVRWCLDAPLLTSATLLTQLEYARKRTGGYGQWSLVTVRSWPEYEWRLLTRISRESFSPVPRTDSGLLRVERRAAPLLPGERLAAYRGFVDYGFTGVGGSLAATLSRRYPARHVRDGFQRLGLDESAPVGHFAPGVWLELFRRLD